MPINFIFLGITYLVGKIKFKLVQKYKLSMQDPSNWTPKMIEEDIKNIGALPCKTEIHAHLTGMKIIPQIAFTLHINEILKEVLHSFQDAIVSVLWRNRPIWRAKMLVLGLFSSPHRCDLFVARAYNTILEVSAFLKSASSSCRQELISFEQNQNISPNSLFAHFLQACKCLNIF